MKQVLVLTPEACTGQGSWHMARSSRIVRTLTVLAAALAVLCTACGSGRPPPRLVTSRYETATGHRIVRDCGFSVPLPGQAHRSLWLFCDTAVTARGGRELGYPILGAGTAAEGPYAAGPGVHDAARAAAAAAAGARLAGLPRRLPVPVRLVRTGLRPRRRLPGQDEGRRRGVGQRVHLPVLDRPGLVGRSVARSAAVRL